MTETEGLRRVATDGGDEGWNRLGVTEEWTNDVTGVDEGVEGGTGGLQVNKNKNKNLIHLCIRVIPQVRPELEGRYWGDVDG